jgi:hypothetical protein
MFLNKLKSDLMTRTNQKLINSFFKMIKHSSFVKVKLNKSQTQLIYDIVKKSKMSFIINDELVFGKGITFFEAFSNLSNIPFYVNVQDKMLSGWGNSSDYQSYIYIPRLFKSSFLEDISHRLVITPDQTIPIYLMCPWDSNHIGSIDVDNEDTYLCDDKYDSIEIDVRRVINGDKEKFGIILYGPPGNGKSHYVRYLAKKYRLPIYIFLLKKDSTNIDIIGMFGRVKGPCIILMEDFDSYFNKREPVMEDCDFSFDGILNVLDGSYASPKKAIYILTANNIDLVDGALKDRPSRFKHIVCVDYPNLEIRTKIFSSSHLSKTMIKKLVKDTEGRSLDQVLHVADAAKKGDTITIPDAPLEYRGLFVQKEKKKNENENELIKDAISS